MAPASSLPGGHAATAPRPPGALLASPSAGERTNGNVVGSARALNASGGTYAVTVEETGLPAGSIWTVQLANMTESSNSSALTFLVPNGSWPIFVHPVSGTHGNPGYVKVYPTWDVGVNGSALTIPIQFTPATSVTVLAVGLPPNSSWSLTARLTVGCAGNYSCGFEGNNTTVGTVGKIHFSWYGEGMFYSVRAPAGYALAYVTGSGTRSSPCGVTTGGAGPARIVAHFGPFERLYFNESTALGAPVLPAGSSWSVQLDPLPMYRACTAGGLHSNITTASGGSVNFTVVRGTHYHFFVYPSSGSFAPGPAQGTLAAPAHTLVKVVKFRPWSSPLEPLAPSGMGISAAHPAALEYLVAVRVG